MKRTGWSLILVAAMLLTVTVVAQAQQEKKVAWIGLLRFGSGDDAPIIGAFREELRKLGWVEGTNILIDIEARDQILTGCASLRTSSSAQKLT